MSKKMIFYVGLTLAISNLFYQEYWGLNALTGSFLYVLISLAHSPEELKSHLKEWKWWLSASLFLTNGFAIFYMNSTLSAVLFVFSFLFFTAVHYHSKLSLPLGLAQGTQSYFTGYFHSLESFFLNFQKKKENDLKKRLVKILLYTVPLVVAIVFLKLYQNADQTFYEWTKFINLDWVSWGFICFYFIMLISLYGLFFFRGSEGIQQLEQNLKNNIPATYEDNVQSYMGIENEKKIALSLLLTLNAMLLLYNFTDLKFILIDLPNPSPTLRYSELLHGGVNSLITSIVLVIFILTFIYRGQLNFQGSKATRILALFWLIQNLIMICTTVIKNYEYFTHWGLTYKRIGVYIYLILAATGLLFTIVKILKVKSIWFLIRNTSLAFFTCFTLMGLVNWDKLIVNYNLTALKPSQIDFEYLIDLGPDGYPTLMRYYKANTDQPEITENRAVWHHLFERFDQSRDLLRLRKNISSWRSVNLRHWKLLKEMDRFTLIYESTYYRES